MRQVHRFRAAASILASILAFSAPRLAVADVSVTDIGTINGRASTGVGINHAGHVAGISEFCGSIGDMNGTPSAPFLTHGILWDGVVHDLGAVEGNPTCSPLGCQSAAFDLNDRDWVVGWTDNGTSGTLAYLWLPAAVPGGNAGFNVLPALSPVGGSAALAINRSGQMVGYSSPGGADKRAIRWQLEAGGPTLTDLGTLRADNTGGAVAAGINDLGQIVGAAVDENFAPQGFLYLPAAAYGLAAGMHNLTGSLNQPSAQALSVNSRGEVVGVVGPTQPWVWLPAAAYGLPAGLTVLPLERNLLGFVPGGISDGGLIVGQAFVQTNPHTHEFVRKAAAWRNGGWIYLNDLLPNTGPWDLFAASAVTHSGKTTSITGVGFRSDVTDVNGLSPAIHGFVLAISCAGDLNDDGMVDQKDVAILRGQIGQTVPAGTGGDLNGDGVVNQQDMMLLTAQLGEACFTSSSTAIAGSATLDGAAPDLGRGYSALLARGFTPSTLSGDPQSDPASFLRSFGLAGASAPAAVAPSATNGTGATTGGNSRAGAQPLSAWPLPYRGGSLQVSFAPGASEGSATDVAIYDLSGRRVSTLSGTANAGGQSLRWDGRDGNGAPVGNGIYFLRASGRTGTTQLKIVVLR